MNKREAEMLFKQLDRLAPDLEAIRDAFDQEPDRRRNAGADEIADELTTATDCIASALAKIRTVYELPDLMPSVETGPHR